MVNKVNFNIIKEIQEKADIVAVISNFIKLTRRGNNYIGLCPFHADKNPSLVVSPKKKIFKCFVCNAKGNVFGFVQQYKKVPFLEAVKIVAQLVGYDDSKLTFKDTNTYFDPKIKRLVDLNKQVNDWYKGFLFNPENTNKLDYLSKRGIDKKLVKEFEFGYAPNERNLIYRLATNADNMLLNRSAELIWNEKELLDAGLITINDRGEIFDFFCNRITIPIYDNNGFLVGFSGRSVNNNVEPKYLNTATTKLFAKNSILFNFHKVKQQNNNKIVIVEGFMDALAYIRSGHENVVAVMGVALTNEHLNILRSITGLETIILSFDNDNAGLGATVSCGQRLMENGFNTYVVSSYDKSYKDVDELLNASGKEKIDEILQERVDFITFLIETTFKDKKPLDEIQKAVNNVIQRMVEFGDNSLLLRQQHLKLLADKSHLAFDDLKAKYELDLSKIIPKQTFQSRYYQPKNTIGLRETFHEEDEINNNKPTPQEIKTHIDDLNNDIKRYETNLISGYNELLFYILKKPEVVGEVVKALNFVDGNMLTQQSYIFKGIKYLHISNESINEKNLANFLNKKSTTNLDVAKDYAKALDYFESIKNNSWFGAYRYSKTNTDHKMVIKNIIDKIQFTKYNLTMASKILTLWKVKKEDPTDKIRIDKLNVEINQLKELSNQFKKRK